MKKMNLDDYEPTLNDLNETKEKWIELIDGLTQLDPFNRISLKKAMQILKQIEHIFFSNFNG